MSLIPESFSWRKFFEGLFSPLNFAKAFVFMVQGSIILLLILCVAFTAIKLKNKILPSKKPIPQIMIQGQTGGHVQNTQDDKKQKFGIINLW